MWWVAVAGMLLPNVTVGDGSYAAFGVGGHFMVILPELQMIIVHRYDTDREEWESTAPSPDAQGTLVHMLLAAYRPSDR
jgi:hypothetical protein